MIKAYNQDRLIASCLAFISSMHNAEHACRDSTSVCSVSLHDFPHNTHNKNRFHKPRLLFEGSLLYGPAVAKVQLLFESGSYARLYGTYIKINVPGVLYSSVKGHKFHVAWFLQQYDTNVRMLSYLSSCQLTSSHQLQQETRSRQGSVALKMLEKHARKVRSSSC